MCIILIPTTKDVQGSGLIGYILGVIGIAVLSVMLLPFVLGSLFLLVYVLLGIF